MGSGGSTLEDGDALSDESEVESEMTEPKPPRPEFQSLFDAIHKSRKSSAELQKESNNLYNSVWEEIAVMNPNVGRHFMVPSDFDREKHMIAFEVWPDRYMSMYRMLTGQPSGWMELSVEREDGKYVLFLDGTRYITRDLDTIIDLIIRGTKNGLDKVTYWMHIYGEKDAEDSRSNLVDFQAREVPFYLYEALIRYHLFDAYGKPEKPVSKREKSTGEREVKTFYLD